MWKIVRGYGVPDKLVKIMKVMYSESKCCVWVNNGVTECFEVKTGVRQGCVLSPFLFVSYWFEFGQNERLFNLDFADDIALIK